MARNSGAAWLLGTLLVTGAAMGQAASGPTVTTADYQRAAGMLADRTLPLIDHAISGAGWLDDGSLVYREQTDGKTAVLRFDPTTGKSAPAFDPQALADAMNLAGGGKGPPVNKDKLPPLAVTRNADGSLLLSGKVGRFRCDTAGCAAVDKPASGDEPGVASPDGSREAFVRDWNLWLRDRASGKETQLTFDGKPDYGYATDNAGWKHTDNAVLVWSPDGSRIATFRHDQRDTSVMTLVGTNVGAPKVEQWRYPFAGDKDINRRRNWSACRCRPTSTARPAPTIWSAPTAGKTCSGRGTARRWPSSAPTEATSAPPCGWPTPPPARCATSTPKPSPPSTRARRP